MEEGLDNRVSLVVVNYNAGQLLAKCVQSSLDQVDEIIIVDNASDDSSLDDCEQKHPVDHGIKYIRNNVNLGYAAACNIGLSHVSNDLILFLNPDCQLDKHAVAEMKHDLLSGADVGMTGGLLLNPDGSEQGGGRRAIPTPWRSFVRAFGLYRLSKRWPRLFNDFYLHELPLPEKAQEVEAISGACMMVKRKAVDDVGLWDEEYFLHCEDLDWCMRFRIKGWKILFVPSARITHALGTCSKGRPLFVEWHKHKGMMRFYRKFFLHQYPYGLMWLVGLGVWMRFSFVSLFKLIGLGRAKFVATKTLTE